MGDESAPRPAPGARPLRLWTGAGAPGRAAIQAGTRVAIVRERVDATSVCGRIPSRRQTGEKQRR
jgi:hypothetical protein